MSTRGLNTKPSGAFLMLVGMLLKYDNFIVHDDQVTQKKNYIDINVLT